jgi:hypothetical protein
MTLAKSIKKEDLDKVRQIKPAPPQKIMNILTAIRIMVAGQINDFIPIEVDNKAYPKKNDKNDILALLLDTKKLIDALQYFLEVIKQFKYNVKNFENLTSKFPQYFVEEDFDKNAEESLKAAKGVDILFKWLYYMNQFFNAAKTVEPMQKNVDQKTIELREAEEKLKIVQEQVAQLNAELAIVMAEKEKAEVVGGEQEKATEEEKRVSEMKAKIEEESAKCQAELNKFKPIMDNCMLLAKSIKKEDLDKVRQIKPAPPKKIMDILTAIRMMVAGQINEYIPIEVDNKAMPKKNEKNDILALLLDTKKLIDAFQYFLEVIKTFKYNVKNFENLNKNFPDFFVAENFETKAAESAKAAKGVDILYKWLYYMNEFFNAAKTVEPMQKMSTKKQSN